MYASAPGKVLIAGGYLVLEDGNEGLVLSVDARIHTTIFEGSFRAPVEVLEGYSPLSKGRFSSLLEATEIAVKGVEGGCVGFVLTSPQFHAAWGYTIPFQPPFVPTPVEKTKGGFLPAPPNSFVQSSLMTSLAVAAVILGEDGLRRSLEARASAGWREGLVVASVQGDNDFYSQRWALEERGLPPRASSLALLPTHLPTPIPPGSSTPCIAKTGLGSSAALTSSLCSALLGWLGVLKVVPTREISASKTLSRTLAGGMEFELSGACCPSEAGRNLIHAAAQVGHCMAQGKTGSGFDIASAVYGSLRFSRIPSSLLEQQCSTDLVARSLGSAEYLAWCHSVVELSRLEGGVTLASFSLPKGLTLMLGDVAGGSETPGMVKKVLSWRGGGYEGDSSRRSPGPDIACTQDFWVSEGGLSVEDGGCVTSACKRAWDRAQGPPLWKSLAATNAGLAACLHLAAVWASENPSQYANALAATRGAPSPGLSPSQHHLRFQHPLRCIAASFALARRQLRELGEMSGVDIEPSSQSGLIEATLKVPGVMAVGVPGAGGYDAIFALVAEGAEEDVEAAWGENRLVTRLGVREGPGRGELGAGIQLIRHSTT